MPAGRLSFDDSKHSVEETLTELLGVAYGVAKNVSFVLVDMSSRTRLFPYNIRMVETQNTLLVSPEDAARRRLAQPRGAGPPQQRRDCRTDDQAPAGTS